LSRKRGRLQTVKEHLVSLRGLVRSLVTTVNPDMIENLKESVEVRMGTPIQSAPSDIMLATRPQICHWMYKPHPGSEGRPRRLQSNDCVGVCRTQIRAGDARNRRREVDNPMGQLYLYGYTGQAGNGQEVAFSVVSLGGSLWPRKTSS
jgi:hypothetical protein